MSQFGCVECAVLCAAQGLRHRPASQATEPVIPGDGLFNRDLHCEELDSSYVAVQDAAYDPQQRKRQVSTKPAHQVPSPKRTHCVNISGISIVVQG